MIEAKKRLDRRRKELLKAAPSNEKSAQPGKPMTAEEMQAFKAPCTRFMSFNEIWAQGLPHSYQLTEDVMASFGRHIITYTTQLGEERSFGIVGIKFIKLAKDESQRVLSSFTLPYHAVPSLANAISEQMSRQA